MWLVKCLKSLFAKYLPTVNMLNSQKTCTTALSLYSLITLAQSELQNVPLSVSQILGVFVITLTIDDKYSLRNRKNLPQTIQLQLSKTQKNWSECFAAYMKPTSNFEHFEKKT